MFRKLRADEIEVRVGSILRDGATLLLYKDARCDMNILDETVGAMRWKREHSRDNANCIVSIWDDDRSQWVSKEDTGTESNTEREKGLASDSFKRACVNWGIGRELYTSPRIKIKCKTKPKQNNSYKYELDNPWEFWGVSVSKIDYDANGNVCLLEIVKGNNILYQYDGRVESYPAVSDGMKQMDELITKAQAQTIMTMVDETGSDRQKFLSYYGVEQFTQMTKGMYGDAMNLLSQKGGKK